MDKIATHRSAPLAVYMFATAEGLIKQLLFTAPEPQCAAIIPKPAPAIDTRGTGIGFGIVRIS